MDRTGENGPADGLAHPVSPLPPGAFYRSHRFVELHRERRSLQPYAAPLRVLEDRLDGRAQSWVNHHEDFCSLYLVRSGRGIHVMDGTAYSVARGDVYAMGPGMAHYFRDGVQLVTDTLHFSPAIFDAPTLAALSETPGFHDLFFSHPNPAPSGPRWMHLTPAAWESVSAQVAELRAEWNRVTPDGDLLTRGLFLRLLVHLARFYADFARGGAERPTGARRVHLSREEVVSTAVRYLDEHYADPVRVEAVASLVCLSPDRFTEVFGAAMGRTPRDYLRHLRIERAKSLLVGTDLSVGEVAARSGFADAGYLTRVFRAATGTTPREYRRRHGQSRR
jgi:AraC-like DNA-binding protein/mannose-6-phosphate isomerase-like protein (cupin superfamily)